jgi:hypothetical protein
MNSWPHFGHGFGRSSLIGCVLTRSPPPETSTQPSEPSGVPNIASI